MTDERQHALEQIVALAERHDLTAADVTAALSARASRAGREGRGVLTRVLGFLGGTFVFAGLGVFIALQWDAMNAGARIVVTLGSGVAAFGLAVLALRDARFARAAAPLFLVAAALEPTGMLVAFDELGSGGDWRLAVLATTGTMAAQFGLTFAPHRRSTLLFLCVFFGLAFWWTAMDLAGVDGTLVALTLGGGLLLLAAGIGRTAHREVTPPWYLVGAAVFLGGLFDVVEGGVFELLFLAAAAGLVSLSVAVRSRTLLSVSTLAILAYTGWFTAEHFADSIGWPLSLIALGLAMIGLSALALRIDRDYVRRAE